MVIDIITTIFIIIAAMVFLSLTISSIRHEYDPKLDEIYDEKGQKLLILWYNKVKGSKVKRKLGMIFFI